MTSKQKAIFGGVGALATIWVGAYILSLVPPWAGFPTWATGFTIFVVSLFVAFDGIDGIMKGK